METVSIFAWKTSARIWRNVALLDAPPVTRMRLKLPSPCHAEWRRMVIAWDSRRQRICSALDAVAGSKLRTTPAGTAGVFSAS